MHSLTKKLLTLAMLVVSVYSIEYTFEEEAVRYIVPENHEATFVCENNDTVSILEISTAYQPLAGQIVIDSVLQEQYKSRFEFSYDGNQHRLTVKDISRALTGYSYLCTSNYVNSTALMIDVAYRPNKVTCSTNYLTKKAAQPLIFQCIAENANPLVDIEEFFPSVSNNNLVESYERNSTHISRVVAVSSDDIIGNIDTLTCIVNQGFPYNTSEYMPKTCSFIKSAPTTVGFTSLIGMQNDNMAASVDNTTHVYETTYVYNGTTNIYDYTTENSSISIYGSVIMICICLFSIVM